MGWYDGGVVFRYVNFLSWQIGFSSVRKIQCDYTPNSPCIISSSVSINTLLVLREEFKFLVGKVLNFDFE
uniref:Uncharacterized protein n=1 Tax=Anguilla anguilla TaxID=7936 RepID=A0A0E9QKV7_ANGAN